jgi:hypothetical protein
MTAPSTTATRISNEAKEQIEELGMQAEFDRMVQHTREVFPDLIDFEVTVTFPAEHDCGPNIVLWASLPNRGLSYDPREDEWGRWKVRTFSPDACRHFCLLAPPTSSSETPASTALRIVHPCP